MLLSRTRRKMKFAAKGLIFDGLDLQELVDERRRLALEGSMGFCGQWDEHRRFQIDFLREQGLAPSQTLLEIGCGPLTAGVPIIGYLQANKYVGVDIRSSVLNLAWGEVGNAGLSNKNPRLICSSSFGSEELRAEEFDFVLSFSVLFHLSDDLLRRYFSEVVRRLKPRGVCFAQVNNHLNSSTWLDFPFVRREVSAYQSMASAAGLRTRNLGPIEGLGFRLHGEERLNEMLVFKNSMRR
jgi:SAM-dependent methyltransferase